jgi:hypothetical protein
MGETPLKRNSIVKRRNPERNGKKDNFIDLPRR